MMHRPQKSQIRSVLGAFRCSRVASMMALVPQVDPQVLPRDAPLKHVAHDLVRPRFGKPQTLGGGTRRRGTG